MTQINQKIQLAFDKLHYLMDNVRNEKQISNIEYELLKKYVIDLFDAFQGNDMELKSMSHDTVVEKKVKEEIIIEKPIEEPVIVPPIAQSAKNEVPLPEPVVKHTVSEIIEPITGKLPVIKEDPVVFEMNEAAEKVVESRDYGKTEVIENPYHNETEEKESASLNDQFSNSKKTEVIQNLNVSNVDSFVIDNNERFAFTNQLFNGDQTAMNIALNELGNCKSVIEAYQYINLNLKGKYSWDDNNPVVAQFKETIKKRFWQ